MSSVDIAGSVFGNIPGIPVGTRWVNRLAMSQDHIHPPLVAGIYGRKEDGARSVVLGGIYDDEDHGETFTYIGSGGRAPGVRFGAQTVDQTFDNNLNQALRSSAKRQVPVRVIRGPKLQSRYTPYAGFRYDGLYTVHNPRQEVGPNGLKICKFDFRRLPGQPPLPELEDRLPDDIEIRREQFRATRKRRTHGGEAERGERPITAKWEGAGSAPAPAPAPRATLAVAAGPVARTSSASTIRPRPREKTQTTTQRRVFSSTTGSGSANSSRAGTPSSGAFGPPASSSIRSGSVQPENASESLDVDPREFGFDDSDEDPEGEDADRDEDDEGEDDEDQDDIFRAVDMVTATFRPIQEKLDEINRPRVAVLSEGSDAEAKEEQLQIQKKQEARKRRKLLVDIGDHIRLVLSSKFGSDTIIQVPRKGTGKARALATERKDTGGYSRMWWEKEMWEYAARYLPLGKDGRMMSPLHLQSVYKKYKMERRAKIRRVAGGGNSSEQADEEESRDRAKGRRKRNVGDLESKGKKRAH